MRQRPLIPLVAAAVLCVAALLVLWLRPAPGEETPGTTPVGTRPRARASSASTAHVPPRPTPPLDTPATLADGSFVVRVRASGVPVSGARVSRPISPRRCDSGSSAISTRMTASPTRTAIRAL